jgi:hypothetical protein
LPRHPRKSCLSRTPRQKPLASGEPSDWRCARRKSSGSSVSECEARRIPLESRLYSVFLRLKPGLQHLRAEEPKLRSFAAFYVSWHDPCGQSHRHLLPFIRLLSLALGVAQFRIADIVDADGVRLYLIQSGSLEFWLSSRSLWNRLARKTKVLGADTCSEAG